MKALSPKKNLFGAISQLRRRRVRRPLQDRNHGRSQWQAPGHWPAHVPRDRLIFDLNNDAKTARVDVTYMKKIFSVAALTLTLSISQARAQTQQMVFSCDLHGATGTLNLTIERVRTNTGFSVYTSGQLVSNSARYSFNGQNQFADFVDVTRNERFRVRFDERPNGLVLVANPFGPGPASYFCQRMR